MGNLLFGSFKIKTGQLITNQLACFLSLEANAPTEIRTPVLALKGLRPSPLDDEGDKE